MPRESFKSDERDYSSSVHVSWGKDQQYVQIATSGWYYGKEDEDEVGVYADLSREQIDHLIKVLRRAKRQAWR